MRRNAVRNETVRKVENSFECVQERSYLRKTGADLDTVGGEGAYMHFVGEAKS